MAESAQPAEQAPSDPYETTTAEVTAGEFFADTPEVPSPTPTTVPAAPTAPEAAPEATPPQGRDEGGRFLPRQQHNPNILQIARNVGIPEAEIAATSPQDLSDRLLILQFARSSQPAQPAQPPAAPPPDFDAETQKYLDEDLDPRLGNLVKAQAKELREHREWRRQQEQERHGKELASHDDAIDAAFLDLGKDYPALGTKGRGELSTDSAEWMQRFAIYSQARQRNGGRPPTPQQIKEIAQKFYGPKPSYQTSPPQVASALSKRKEEWSEGNVARTTQRSGAAEPKGEARATRYVAQFLRDHGQGATADDEPDALFK